MFKRLADGWKENLVTGNTKGNSKIAKLDVICLVTENVAKSLSRPFSSSDSFKCKREAQTKTPA